MWLGGQFLLMDGEGWKYVLGWWGGAVILYWLTGIGGGGWRSILGGRGWMDTFYG